MVAAEVQMVPTSRLLLIYTLSQEKKSVCCPQEIQGHCMHNGTRCSHQLWHVEDLNFITEFFTHQLFPKYKRSRSVNETVSAVFVLLHVPRCTTVLDTFPALRVNGPWPADLSRRARDSRSAQPGRHPPGQLSGKAGEQELILTSGPGAPSGL
ncbi:uncharacterized protein LOC118935533 isoform X2 [Manis pentadactyla]|uniref:uncharacterized protein LOC118935533 isoform X2 n=1 Tax=Manis pentadactyla TaxID=143292 RepID=UPI00255C96F0|nr:uncharacterized protein LOC118935533 isoform X2 [Manis pentadactyla]